MYLCVFEVYYFFKAPLNFFGRGGFLLYVLDYEEKEYFADSSGNEASLLHQPRVTWRKIMFRWGARFH